METNFGVQYDAGRRFNLAVEDIMRRDKISRHDAMRVAATEYPQLYSAYSSSVRTSKNYDLLSASEQAMIRAQNDPDWVMRQAGDKLSQAAMLTAGGPNSSAGIAQISKESFADALKSLMRQYPGLGAAYSTGFIASDAWSLLSTLAPNLSGEIKKIHGVDGYNLRAGRYSDTRSGVRKYDNRGNEYHVYVR